MSGPVSYYNSFTKVDIETYRENMCYTLCGQLIVPVVNKGLHHGQSAV